MIGCVSVVDRRRLLVLAFAGVRFRRGTLGGLWVRLTFWLRILCARWVLIVCRLSVLTLVLRVFDRFLRCGRVWLR